ncbi:hypothetical protein KIW84_010890 [Lathyrus oleraceus]|uniref:Uncharacterized protein n=1 Tax=Pisum sativum TaxID=3888 RepID=A0A9D4YN84_PEA|nr:hypothetical protein KIW84_010890 [Pisum sativum]
MEIVSFIPKCGSIRYTRRGAYHELKSNKEVSSNFTNKNVGTLGSKKLKIAEMMSEVQPKIFRLSTNLWKKLRDGYVHGMLCMAAHVAHLNNGEICFFKKIHYDDGDDVLYLKAS